MKTHTSQQNLYVQKTRSGRRRPRKKPVWPVIVAAVLILAVAVTAGVLLLQPSFKLLEESMTVELGSPLQVDKAMLIEAKPDILDRIEVDTAQVDTNQVGEYPLSFRYEKDVKTLTVMVTDTTPPTAELVPGDIHIMVGKTLTASDLVARYDDHSPVTISFGEKGDLSLDFPQVGDVPVILTLTDAAGNRKEYPLTIQVVPKDTVPPVLSGLDTLDVRLGSIPDLTDGVSASDDMDGDVTARITHTGDLDLFKEGTYTITYAVKDLAGNEAKADRTVTVTDPYKSLRASNEIIIDDDPAVHQVLGPVLDYLGSKVSRMGIVYYDLETGKGFFINQDTQFRSASTAKLFVNMALYDRVDKGEVSLDQRIYYQSSDYEGGTGVIQGMDRSKGFTLATLADYAMKYSDNIAFNMIRRFLGRDESFEYYESVIGHDTNRKMTSMGAADGYDLMKLLYTSDSENFKHMLEVLKETVFSSMLPKYLPEDVAVAHKIGFYAGYYHDVGIVYDKDGPYILAVFSGGLSSPEETIAQVSRLVFENR